MNNHFAMKKFYIQRCTKSIKKGKLISKTMEMKIGIFFPPSTDAIFIFVTCFIVNIL